MAYVVDVVITSPPCHVMFPASAGPAAASARAAAHVTKRSRLMRPPFFPHRAEPAARGLLLTGRDGYSAVPCSIQDSARADPERGDARGGGRPVERTLHRDELNPFVASELRGVEEGAVRWRVVDREARPRTLGPLQREREAHRRVAGHRRAGLPEVRVR